jgi:hypothetical protein
MSDLVDDRASVENLRRVLDRQNWFPLEEAARLLEWSVRTMYRRRGEFEYLRKKGHLYFSPRSIRRFIEEDHYNPTETFDLTSEQ